MACAKIILNGATDILPKILVVVREGNFGKKHKVTSNTVRRQSDCHALKGEKSVLVPLIDCV
jgi:hypothetical protein